MKIFKDQLIKAAELMTVSSDEVLNAHEIRNSVVYNPDYKLSTDQAKKILDIYESAIKSIGLA